MAAKLREAGSDNHKVTGSSPGSVIVLVWYIIQMISMVVGWFEMVISRSPAGSFRLRAPQPFPSFRLPIQALRFSSPPHPLSAAIIPVAKPQWNKYHAPWQKVLIPLQSQSAVE